MTLTDGTSGTVYKLSGASWFGGNLNYVNGKYEFSDTEFFNIIGPNGVVANVAGVEHSDTNRPDLANIDVPTLILHGQEDSIFPMSIAEELEAEIPDAQLVEIPLAGHTANLEQPEASNAAIRGFLGSVFAGTRQRP